MFKGEVGNFLKEPNNDLLLKVLHKRVGEVLLMSVDSIGGWNLLYYENINRTSRSGRTTYAKIDLKIQKGGKEGVSVPWDGSLFCAENICKVLVKNGLHSEAEKFTQFTEYQAKWQAEEAAKIQADIAAKAKAEAIQKSKEEKVKSFVVGESYMIPYGVGRHEAVFQGFSKVYKGKQMGKFSFIFNGAEKETHVVLENI